MGQITNEIAKGQLVRYTFTQDAVAASQAAVAMNAIETGATSSTLDVTEIVVPFNFDVVAIAVSASAACTAGTCTADATINGTVTALQGVLDTTNTTRDTTKQPRETDRGTAGQRIGVKLTTSADWAPITADIVVDVYAIVDLEGV